MQVLLLVAMAPAAIKLRHKIPKRNSLAPDTEISGDKTEDFLVYSILILHS